MDMETIKHLELLADTRSGACKHSLFGVVNWTKTSVGARLLRSNVRVRAATHTYGSAGSCCNN
jgi:DNA mismatch repair ATPase MutS